MVPGSIAGGVTGFFSDIFPSDRTMALGSIQPLVKMSKVKVKQSRNRPGVAQRVPGGLGSKKSMTFSTLRW